MSRKDHTVPQQEIKFFYKFVITTICFYIQEELPTFLQQEISAILPSNNNYQPLQNQEYQFICRRVITTSCFYIQEELPASLQQEIPTTLPSNTRNNYQPLSNQEYQLFCRRVITTNFFLYSRRITNLPPTKNTNLTQSASFPPFERINGQGNQRSLDQKDVH